MTDSPSSAPTDESDDGAERLAEPVDTEHPPRLAFPVVGIGASAGGIEALNEFFKAMRPDGGMAFVVIQHLPPDRDSFMADILAKHTQMPVSQVLDGIPVEADHVYVIRPGHTLTIKEGVLRLGESVERPGHARPVDDFFRSLAEEQRERAICVVMSGMGSNGTAGARMIKAVGGVCIAQDPDTAKFPLMPRNLIEAGLADFILPPADIPQRLLHYATHPYTTGRQNVEALLRTERHQYGEIITILRSRTRQDFSSYKKPTVLRRIQRRMGLNQLHELGDYASLLRQNPTEVGALSDDLLIHVTGFFRDGEAWEALRNQVIVPLVTEREAGTTIRCWVTACATGEEAYTLAMLLMEAAESAGKHFDVKIFATDMAERSLAHARTGAYPLGIEGELSMQRVERFFDKDDSRYRVKKVLRETVVFAPQNLLQDPPFSRLDICTCRNLLIYLDPEAQQRVLALLHFGLRKGGTLFLGNSETIGEHASMFEPIDKKWRIYRRVGPTRKEGLEFPIPSGLANTLRERGFPGAVPAISVPQVTNRTLLERYTPVAITVDRQHQVVYFHGDTSPYLDQPRGEPTRDILVMVREKLRSTVRAALHKASTENTRVTLSDGLLETGQGPRRISVTVAPFEKNAAPGYYLISFQQLEETPPAATVAGSPPSDAQLENELLQVRSELQSSINELQTSNEELKASNEEITSINEELQSTNEELETNKEELQSLNEELSTVNAQLQAKMEELQSATNDLSSLLSSTDIAVIFLDRRFRIRRFTPAVKDLVELIPSDIGRPLDDLARKFDDPELLDDAATVLDKLVPMEREISSNSGRTYVRRVLPYRTADNRIDGVVVTFVDITARKAAEDALRQNEERLRRVVAIETVGIAFFNADGQIVDANNEFLRLVGYTRPDLIAGAIRWDNLTPPQWKQRTDQANSELKTTGRIAPYEKEYFRKDGTRWWGLFAAATLEDNQAVAFMADLTERHRAEEERMALLQREQTAREQAEAAIHTKDHFLAAISHEMRTPMSAILLWAKLLHAAPPNSKQIAEGIDAILQSAEAQKQLIDDLLDTAQIAAGKLRLEMRPALLAPLIHEAVEMTVPAAAAKQIKLLPKLDSAPRAMLDPGRFRQVVWNILSNAVKFTPNGGRVKIDLLREGGWAELRVKDTGRGIDARFMPHIFEPFSQAEGIGASATPGGLGLGLAISKQLIERQGGTISVQSDGPDRGTVVIVRVLMLEEGDGRDGNGESSGNGE
jgi:two-component system CheB/CheR fusion protein